MKNTVFLAIISIITVTNLHPNQVENNFKNCNPRLSSEEIFELANKNHTPIEDILGTVIREGQNVDINPVTHCQENPIDRGCGKVMAFLLDSSKAYWLWPSPAQKKAAQIAAEYKAKMDSASSNLWKITPSK